MVTSNAKWVGRPAAKAHTSVDEAHPTPQNPALRGLALTYLTRILVNAPPVQALVYNNAGFPKLRNHPQLSDIPPRLDPTVIKSDGHHAVDIKNVFAELLEEDFAARVPQSKLFPSVLDYHNAYKSGKLTPVQVAKALLPLIRRDVKAARHSVAFVETHVDEVLRSAQQSTDRYKSGKPISVLDGVPIAFKDQVDIAGYKLFHGSKIDSTHKDNIDTYCVLPWQQAGGLMLGKLTMHEYGMDTTNLNPNYGTPLNPYNPGYYTGGSSGGSGYALAAGLIPVAHGADGGGSIRIPSSFCGVYGLKSSHKRVSIRPSHELASSVGVHGPMAANMVDLEVAYRLIAHPDARDLNAKQFIAPHSTVKLEKRSRTLGVDRAWLSRADPAVKEACQRAIEWLVITLDYKVVEITLPMLHEAQLAHAMSIVTECASGVPDYSKLTAPNQVLFSAIGAQATAVDLLQAQKVRTVLMEHLAHLYSRFPGMIIVSPTTPNAGWPIVPGDLTYGTSNGNMSIKTMTYVFVANFTGCPAITTPVGYADAKGGPMPIGFMGMGEWCSEDELLAFGYDCERYLHEAVEGGRRLPKTFVNVLDAAAAGKLVS